MELVVKVVFVICFLVSRELNATRFPDCTTKGTLQVDLTSSGVVIVCDQISNQHTVSWTVETEPSRSVTLGSCKPDGQCTSVDDNYPLSRSVKSTNESVSELGITQLSDSIDGYVFMCSTFEDGASAQCQLDVVGSGDTRPTTANITPPASSPGADPTSPTTEPTSAEGTTTEYVASTTQPFSLSSTVSAVIGVCAALVVVVFGIIVILCLIRRHRRSGIKVRSCMSAARSNSWDTYNRPERTEDVQEHTYNAYEQP
ncbi:hypothetical protein BaRGS_00012940 [Batillaria attramentaria]|uniref:Immunoglobulin subtype domain-containing protein n=1 Tax=Batillaria attramentaria TaxID=370345 RepID=A0ABD0L8U1_9CAEN